MSSNVDIKGAAEDSRQGSSHNVGRSSITTDTEIHDQPRGLSPSMLTTKPFCLLAQATAQKAQYPVTTTYTFNHSRDRDII